MHHAAIVNHHQDWQIPHPQQLEGPGMPVGRSTSIHSAATNVPNIPAGPAVGTDGAATEGGDADADNDDGRTYCFCDGVSYGEMIACDDGNCEREWVSSIPFASLRDIVKRHLPTVSSCMHWLGCAA